MSLLHTFDLKTSINSVGLVLSMTGVYIVYANSPLNESVISGGGASTDFVKIERETKRKNVLMRTGIYLVLGGTFLQLASNYLPSGS
jgi:hypothetical protein